LRTHDCRRGWLFLRSATLALAAGLTVFCGLVRQASARQVIDETGRRVNVPDVPDRIVSLAPSITEIVYALGLSNRLLGDTDYCDYPAEARSKPHVGAVSNPSLEKIVALRPDLVLGTAEGNRRETADQLERLGIPLYGLSAHTVDQTLRSIEDLGAILGCEARARRLAESLRARVESVEQKVRGRERPKVLFAVWIHPLITAGHDTFIADLIRRAGGASITDDFRTEWPRMSLEEVFRRDPDVILFPRTDGFSPGLGELSRLPGWKDLRAVREQRLYFVPETIMRPCPRLVDALEQVAAILHPEIKFEAESRQ
jgi:iron complex transport system substrate-binding protein